MLYNTLSKLVGWMVAFGRRPPTNRVVLACGGQWRRRRRGVVVVGHTVSLLDKQSSRPPSQNISEHLGSDFHARLMIFPTMSCIQIHFLKKAPSSPFVFGSATASKNDRPTIRPFDSPSGRPLMPLAFYDRGYTGLTRIL